MDKDLLLSVLPKDVMVNVCKKFKVSVDGFQRNLERAQINKLGSSLRSAMVSAELGRKRKGGTTPVALEEIVDYLYQKSIEQFSFLSDVSIEEILVESEQNPNFGIFHGILVIYKQFPEFYGEKLDVIMKNRKNNDYLFKGVSEVTDVPIIDKINGVIYSSYEKNSIQHELINLKNEVESKDPKAIEKMREKLVEGTEQEFFTLLRGIKKEVQQDLILAFLLKDDHYQNKTYFPLVLHAISNYNKLSTNQLSERVSDLAVNNHDLNKQLEEKTKELERMKQREEEHKTVEKHYSELKIQYEKIEEAKRTAEWKNKKCGPFVQYFTQLGSNHNILIVTNERNHFLGTPLENFLYSCSELAKDKKRKNLSLIEGKHLFITRVSYRSTQEWVNLTKYLEKNKITYSELSGYGSVDYLEEIATVLNRKENYAYDYYL